MARASNSRLTRFTRREPVMKTTTFLSVESFLKDKGRMRKWGPRPFQASYIINLTRGLCKIIIYLIKKKYV